MKHRAAVATAMIFAMPFAYPAMAEAAVPQEAFPSDPAAVAQHQPLTAYPNRLPYGVLGTFFSSDDDLNMECYLSQDGIRMQHIFRSPSIAGRDISCQYYQGVFYVCLVTPQEEETTFTISKSYDLKNWTTDTYTVIARGKQYRAVWAPDLFIDDDGAAYVYFAKQRDRLSKHNERKFDIYVSAASNIERGDFQEAVKVDLPERSDNYIDAQVRKINGSYYMIVKNEAWITNNDNKSPLLLKSKSPMGNFAEVTDWPLKAVRGYEGFSLVSINGRIYIYGDNYSHKYDSVPQSQCTVWSAEIGNMETGPYEAEFVESGRTLRHGTVIPLSDHHAERVVEALAEDGEQETPSSAAEAVEDKSIALSREDYGNGESGGKNIVIDVFAPAPHVVYTVPKKKNVVIERMMNPYGVKQVKFRFAGIDSASLDLCHQRTFNSREVDGKTITLTLADNGQDWLYDEP